MGSDFRMVVSLVEWLEREEAVFDCLRRTYRSIEDHFSDLTGSPEEGRDAAEKFLKEKVIDRVRVGTKQEVSDEEDA